MNFREYSRLERVGFIGIAVLSIISIVFAFLKISLIYTTPLLLPWFVFIMVGRASRHKRKK